MSLKQWLKDNGETYEKFAERVHISVPFLCNILIGKQSNIKVDLLLKIAKATKLDVGDLAEDLLKAYNDYHVQQLQLQEDKNKEPL
jgi:transcriptional regulator with XRE-family HTH domain